MDNPIFDHPKRSFDRFIVVSDKGEFMDANSRPIEFITQAYIFPGGQHAINAAAAMNGLFPSQSWEAISVEVTFRIK